MTPQELKNSILQLAIQGKLVEQRPEEGTAAELVGEIVARNGTHGTTKTTRTTKTKLRVASRVSSVPSVPVVPPIPDDEKPFDIPESWEWVRLGDVVSNHGQKKPTGDFSYIDIGSIDNKNQRLSNDETIVHAENASPRARKIVQKGDVIYATVRPYLHNVCVIDREFSREPIASTGFAVMACADCLDNRFLFHFLLSPDFDRYANSAENAKGVAYPAISDKRLYNAIIPLPPLAEQKRIVAKIEELLPLIDRYEKAWSKLEDFNRRFPVDMQKSVLQMAIQGKLVEQRAEEGTAAELLRDILTRRRRDAEVGRSPRDRRVSARNGGRGATALPPIPDDEKPFDIPESWEWVRLGEIAEVQLGKMLDKGKNKGTPYPYLANLSVRWRSFDLSALRMMPFTESECEKFALLPGDVLMCEGGVPGRCAVWREKNSPVKYQKAIHRIRSKILFPDFIQRYFETICDSSWFVEMFTGTTIKHLPRETLCNTLIPLPPLAEQKRIVAKLEEILPLCERLK